MSLTQNQVNDLLQQFIGQSAGQRLDYYGYAGECPSLAKRWYDVVHNGHLNGPMVAPPSTDGWGSGYWSHAPGSVLELFTVESYNPNASYPQGSLFVSTRTHHIGIMLDNHPGSDSATVFHQNANPDGSAAHTSQRLKVNIDGILVIKVSQPAPVNPCSYETTNQHVMQTRLQPTNWYNLNNTSWDALANNPVSRLNAGTPFTVGGYAYSHIAPNEKYAMTPEDFDRAQHGDFSTNNGINTKDLEEIPAPAPPPPPPPVAAPPNAPLPFPSSNEPYTVVSTIKGYPTANSAVNDIKATGIVDAGKYVVYNSQYGMINVTKVPGRPGSWINPADNVRPPSNWDDPVVLPEPTPAPVPDPAPVVVAPPVPKPDTTWKKLSPLTTTRYISTNLSTITIHDINGKGPDTTLEPNTELEILFTFDRDGVRYGMTLKAYQYKSHSDNWYGVPMSIVRIDSVYDTATTVAERLYLRNAKFGDHVGKALHNIEQFVQVIDGILKTRKVKK